MRISDWSSDVCSSDLKTWTFKLRDGLTFHDGAPVTAEDCVASLRRWGARDGMGQQLMNVTETMTAVDERTFEMKLGVAYGLVLESIGKISSNVPFILSSDERPVGKACVRSFLYRLSPSNKKKK